MADAKVKVITWVFVASELKLQASIVEPKETVSWNLRDFYPHMDWGTGEEPKSGADDLEIGLCVNGLKQRLSDKASVSKDQQFTPKDRLDMMVKLGEKLLEARTYALGGAGGGGGLSSEALWNRQVKVMVEAGVEAQMAIGIACTMFPKAPQTVAEMARLKKEQEDLAQAEVKKLEEKERAKAATARIAADKKDAKSGKGKNSKK